MSAGSLRFWDYARKAGIAALTGVSIGVAYHVFPNPWDTVANAVLVVAGYYGVFGVRNLPVPGLPTPSPGPTQPLSARPPGRGPL